MFLTGGYYHGAVFKFVVDVPERCVFVPRTLATDPVLYVSLCMHACMLNAYVSPSPSHSCCYSYSLSLAVNVSMSVCV
jgi:hypothetical protein